MLPTSTTLSTSAPTSTAPKRRKRAKEALKDSERLYHSLFDNTEDGFQLVDLIYDETRQVSDFKFINVNSAYEKQTGLKADFVLGRRAKEFDPNIERYWLDVYQDVDKTGKAIHKIDHNKNLAKWLGCLHLQILRWQSWLFI